MASVVNGVRTRSVHEDNLEVAAGIEPRDCAWCSTWFEDISDLLAHVDTEHLDDKAAA